MILAPGDAAGEAWTVEHRMLVRRFGDGPEVLWIHGLGEWSVSFDAIARHPRLAGFTHVLPDLPGYGRSPRGEAGGVRAHAAHLVAWLRERAPAILVGHSMGGVIATLIAEQLPVRAVVNIDGNLTRGDCTFSAQAVAYTQGDFCAHGFAALRAQVFARGASGPALRGYHAALVAADPARFWADAAELVAMSEAGDLAPRFAALRAPALFVAGTPGGSCEASRAQLAELGARWVGIGPAGHWPFIDQPDAFAAAVADVLPR